MCGYRNVKNLKVSLPETDILAQGKIQKMLFVGSNIRKPASRHSKKCVVGSNISKSGSSSITVCDRKNPPNRLGLGVRRKVVGLGSAERC